MSLQQHAPSAVTPHRPGRKQAATADPLALDCVPSTLMIPLAARAFGDEMFPDAAIGDRHAADILHKLDSDVTQYLDDHASVFGVLTRTTIFRKLALEFFDTHPRALGANLGCGLACYFQWLDRGTNRWLDTDMPQVIALRERLLAAPGKRLRQCEIDLSEPGWWDRLALPKNREAAPVLLMCEGVLMYFKAAQVARFLHEFGERAPPGSQLLLDALCWLAIGCGGLHPSVRHTSAQFHWGPRSPADFTDPHPRLILRSEHAVLDRLDWSTFWMCQTFKALYGVPLYGITRLEAGA